MFMQKTARLPRQSVAMKQSRRRENIAGYLFMAPSLLFFLGFVIFPMVMCLVYSFTDYTMTSFSFAGFDNYKRMFQDAIFGKALWNTIILVIISVPVTCFFSLWAASIISKLHDRTTSFFRCVFYLPVVTGSVAVTVVWKWIFNNYTGVLNYVCKALGIISTNVNWLGDPGTALWCIITILLTTSVGQPIVLYVSALSNVDHSLVEAASVDGATNMQTFWRIKWPQIMPTTLYILVITTINSFQCFALIQLLTSGGPNHATETIMYYIYYNAFKLQNYGYGSAMGIILAIIIAIFSAIQFRLAKTDNG
jgi:multiple sugar transport system permease protein